MLDSKLIAALYATRTGKQDQPTGEVKFVRSQGELAEWKASEASNRHFDSKQGSMRRSRKGVSRIMPNGYARYYPTWEAETVIAYKAAGV
jgi:hypothetical protein